ncbi:unnamed protein product [Blepharisma stoltei]|uniref:Uncharacterized protein n=1 Tax=Blepharisma stoltei TaxID=1481888 RepID=A0AAU9KKL1_9CILI|nr:unnamed protein product [Blepharisma stoltei]
MRPHINKSTSIRKLTKQKSTSKSTQTIIGANNHIFSKIQTRFPSVSSHRSLSILKPRENLLRKDSKSVEPPDYSCSKTRSPEPFSPDQNSICTSALDLDYQRLEYLVNKNNSARKNLLTVQQQIINLNAKHKMRDKFHLIQETDENINHNDIKKPNLTMKIDLAFQYKSSVLSTRQRLKLPPIDKDITNM